MSVVVDVIVFASVVHVVVGVVDAALHTNI